MAKLVVYGNMAGRAAGSDAFDENIAPITAIPNPLAQVNRTTSGTEVQANAIARTSVTGNTGQLLAEMRINQRPGSQAAVVVGTTFTDYPDGAGTPIVVDVVGTGDEKTGDRVRVRFEYDWATEFYDVNENDHRIQVALNVAPPTGFSQNLVSQDFTQPLNNSTNRSDNGSYEFEATIGQRFTFSAFAAIFAQADRLRTILDYTDITLNYRMGVTYLGKPSVPTPPPDPTPIDAKIAITQVASPNPGTVGDPLTFTVYVTNPGPSPLSSVYLEDTLPAGAIFISANASQGFTYVSPMSAGVIAAELGALAVGATASVTITVLPQTAGFAFNTVNALGSIPGAVGVPALGSETSTIFVSERIVAPIIIPPIYNPLNPTPATPRTLSRIIGFSTRKVRTTRSRTELAMVLTFSQDMIPSNASSRGPYRLISAGRDRRFGTRDDRALVIKKAIYDEPTRTVSLVPIVKLSLNQPLQLTVDGSAAMFDMALNLLDGDGDGQPGGRYVIRFGRAARP